MGKAVGESLCPNNESLESMQVRCFHRGKTVKCTLILEYQFMLKKRKRKEDLKPACIVYSEGALFLLIKRLLANTRSSVFVFHFHAENVLIFLLLKQALSTTGKENPLCPNSISQNGHLKSTQKKNLLKKKPKYNTTCKTSTNLI